MKLIESKKKTVKGMYSCPCYIYPDRSGSRDKPSYVMSIDLKVTALCNLIAVHQLISFTARYCSPESTTLTFG